MSAASKTNALGIAAISIAIASIIIAGVLLTGSIEVEVEDEDDDDEYVPRTREIFLFTEVDEHIDEEKLSIPPDMFSQDTIAVKKGDRVKVHFYNLEPAESQEHHTFTINDPSYKIHTDLNADENSVIEFVASESGIFEYLCTYHQPTMRGELIVLP